MKPWVRSILILIVPFLVAACDQNGNFTQEPGLEKLSRGVSSEADVRNAMGQPDTVWEAESGERSLEYPKGPAGARTWIFYIGKDGKLSDYKQVLTEENFARIKVGMNKEEVRRMLGRPGSVVQFARKNEEVWDWRYVPSDASQAFFNVHMDITSGVVTGTSRSDIGGH
ncbi:MULTISPECIES: outer membrane protein assembly factor BamE domain-containing protein [Oxalobacteraceae]|jgi:outer membrane protein assembly factor BamE (lipoprotein component of BamABCDE complex)|uniref:outer membrane protein assembly factor BamE domain-containing protein n=1 Tax=Oxalobacteraceae TaxID=75682 RepID=UPI002D094A4D|nr:MULTISPECIES: outer membrane protein assembly factor BamE [Oxalobacteraceae]HTD03293.1 outer membrane protein assembly factor BamE [Undibacterium sp.]HWW06605.1 outer membrane protein assembly factor BamE [Collimonas sp.]